MKYWVITNKNLAEKLGIKTDKASIGDIYLIREVGKYCPELKPTLDISGYQYNC